MFVYRQQSLFLGHKKKRDIGVNLLIIKRFLSWYARCSESFVHRIIDANPLSLLSGSKSVRRCLVLLLALAATSVLGQGSVLTLAMVRYDQSPALTPRVAHNISTTDLLCYDASVSHFQYRVAALELDHQNTSVFSFDPRLEKPVGSNQQHDLLPLVHTKLYSDGRMGKWMYIAAGYGQVSEHETDIAKNTVDLQRPGFAYLKASFSF